MTNPFDRFDKPSPVTRGGNPFDQFDPPTPERISVGVQAAIRDNLAENPPIADNPWEAFASGWNMSASDIAARVATGNRKLGVVLPEDAGLLYKGLNMAGRVVGDLPATAAGFIGGGVAGGAAGSAAGSAIPVAGTAAGGAAGALVGAGFGSAALPEGMRQTYMAAQESGKIKTFGDFVNTTTKVVLETGKAGVIGAVTAPVGGAVGGGLARAGVNKVISTGADGVTQALVGTAVGGALQGEVPDADDFILAAGGAVGFHVVGAAVGGAPKLAPTKRAEKVATNMRAVYAEHGIPPWEVFEKAKTDPVLAQELMGETPDGKPFVRQAAKYAKNEPPPFKPPADPDPATAALPATAPPAGIPELIAFAEGSAIFGKRNKIPEAHVVSSANAVGRYQVTPGTAHQYMGGAFFGVGKVYNKADPGMRAVIMEKLKDPEVNRKVADKILVDLTKRYKLPDGAVDVEAVLIAYNAGPGMANRFIRQGRNYERLPTETQRYLQRAEGFKGKVDRGIEEPPPVKAPEPVC